MNVNNVTAGFTRFKWPIYGNCIHLYVWKSFSSGGPSICLPCCLYCFGQSCGVFSNENRHNVTPSQSTRMWPKLTFAKLVLNWLPQTVWSNKHCRLGLQLMGFLCNLSAVNERLDSACRLDFYRSASSWLHGPHSKFIPLSPLALSLPVCHIISSVWRDLHVRKGSRGLGFCADGLGEAPVGLAVTGGNATRTQRVEMQTFHSDVNIVMQL